MKKTVGKRQEACQNKHELLVEQDINRIVEETIEKSTKKQENQLTKSSMK